MIKDCFKFYDENFLWIYSIVLVFIFGIFIGSEFRQIENDRDRIVFEKQINKCYEALGIE